MTVPVRAALGLGSNLGDRHQHLASALAVLRATPRVDVIGVSPLVETDPVGGPEQPDYLNAVVVVDTTLTADELFALAQRCEREARRQREVRWGARTLDVDVLAYGDVASGDPALTLPHPLATKRAFVMVPWAAVDPDFVVAGRTVAEWADALGDDGVRPAQSGEVS